VHEENRRMVLKVVHEKRVEEGLKFHIEKGGFKLENLFE
jgi:hypothetical protein